MKKIRILMFLIIAVVMIMCLASCTSEEANTESPTNDTVESSYIEEKLLEAKYPFEITYLLKDTNGNVIKVMLYNQETKETIIQEFFYEYDYRTEKFIIYETRETVQNKVNHTCRNGKDCKCMCNESNTTITHPGDDGPKWSESNPVGTVIWHDDSFKLTLKNIIYDDHGNVDIKVEFENNSIYDSFIMCDSASLDGYTIDLDYGDSILAGTKSIDVMTIYASTLEECEISNPSDLTFSIHVSKDDGTYEQLSVGINLYLNIKN